MAISNIDQLVDAMANNSSRIVIDKTATTGQVSGGWSSFWRATGQPGQGAIPTTPAVCDMSLVGAIQYAQQTPPVASYLSILEAVSNVTSSLEIHDRLMHMGGLSGTVTTAQTVGLNLLPNLGTLNLDARKGDANYSDVQWWIEWYTTTGATNVNITVNVTYDDGSTGNLTAFAFGASTGAQRMTPINSFIPAAQSGRYIRGVNSVTLSATTGTAGNFGVTATRYRAGVGLLGANQRWTADWAALGLPEIHLSSCLFAVNIPISTTIGTLRATGKISHG